MREIKAIDLKPGMIYRRKYGRKDSVRKARTVQLLPRSVLVEYDYRVIDDTPRGTKTRWYKQTIPPTESMNAQIILVINDE